MKKLVFLMMIFSLATVSCKKTKKKQGLTTNDQNGSGMTELVEASAPGYEVSTLNFRQLPDSLIAMAGITAQEDIEDVYDEWENQKSQLPKEGALSEITPASWNATFFLAAQVCDFIKTFPPNGSPAEISQYFAGRFLGRSLSSDEIKVFQDLDQELTSENRATKNQLICTVIASSSEAIEM